MGNVVPFRRVLRQGRLDSLRKHLPVSECHDKFLSAAYLAFEDAMRRIAIARAELDQEIPGRDPTTPELVALGFALYRLRPMGIDAEGILESVASKLGELRESYRRKAMSDVYSANDYALGHSLPRRSAIEQTLGPNGDDITQTIEDRCRWLKDWRRRLGITQVEAARILGYSDRRQIGKIEWGGRNPAWEKIFIAIAAENARAAYAKDSGP
jgi:DNA-binding XRE family transcriptional regulator